MIQNFKMKILNNYWKSDVKYSILRLSIFLVLLFFQVFASCIALFKWWHE